MKSALAINPVSTENMDDSWYKHDKKKEDKGKSMLHALSILQCL